ncbi:MAG: FeoA family protein [Candidatus Kariarchaeaceae archaeon]
MEMTLDQMEVGQKGKIVKLVKQGVTRKVLLEMGILPNAEVTIIRSAPLGDPLELLIQGYHLSVRKEDAQMIVVEVLDK